MAKRVVLVLIAILIVRVLPVQQRTAFDTGYIVIVVAVLAEGHIFRSGVVADPDAGPAVGADGGVLAETVCAKGLAVKDGAFLGGTKFPTLSAGKGIVWHSISSVHFDFLAAKKQRPPHTEKPLFGYGVTSFRLFRRCSAERLAGQ